MANTIQILPAKEVKLIKQINLVSQNRHGVEIIIGFLFYERNFSSNYKMAGRKENVSELEYLLTYPKQNDFPEDEIDILLLYTIKSEFPKSTVFNKTLFTTSDVLILKNYTNRPSEKADIIISPDFSGQQLENLVGKSFKQFGESVNLYANGPIDYLKNIMFNGECDFARHAEIIDQLYRIEFL
jgi:hypothetical protein